MRINGVTGWKNSGKTHLMERIVAEIVGRGLTVSTVTHAHHDTEVDLAGTDSFRHRDAGASQVLLASPCRWALMTELRDDPEPPFEALPTRLSAVDLVPVEGYKRARHPKLETWRAVSRRPLLAATNPTVRAVAADTLPPGAGSIRVFDLNDTRAIADFMLAEVAL